MKTFTISVDAYGLYEEYTLQAKDLASAKRKAKRKAIRDFCSDMHILKVESF